MHHGVLPCGMYQLEPLDEGESGPCECCGGLTRIVTGLVYRNGTPQTGFRITWTAGQVARHGAEFLLITGPWGEATKAADRAAVALMFFKDESAQGSFTVVDAKPPDTVLAGRSLRREEVIGTPLAAEIFQVVDFLWLYDVRLAEVSGLPEGAMGMNCPCGSDDADFEEEEKAPDFSDVPGFGEGPGPEMPESPPTRLVVIGTWLLGGLFLASGAAFFTLGGSIAEKAFGAITATAPVPFMVSVGRRYLAGKKRKS